MGQREAKPIARIDVLARTLNQSAWRFDCDRSMTPVAPAWDAFVAAMPAAPSSIAPPGRASSRPRSAIRCHYTLAEQDGAIVGVLPLAQVKTTLFGNTLVSDAVLRLWRPAGGRPRDRRGARGARR